MQPIRKQRSHLFTLRLWQERDGRKEQTVRFKVQHVLNGEVHYFQDWTEVCTFIQSMTQEDPNE